MSVPYPGTAAKPRSQNDDHLAGLAARYIEQHLDETVGWDEVVQHLELVRGKTHKQASDGALLAALDLEWSGVMAHDVATERYRRPLPADPRREPLDDVAAAVLALGWPRHDGKPYRTIQQTFVELDGRYRHCDVYWAMHERLKDSHLKCNRAYWRALGDDVIVAARLADPSLPAADRVELERQRETELVADYIASIPHPVEVEYPLGARRADIFDRKRRLIVEAKAYDDDVIALGAVTQAMLYRTLANRDTELVDRVAVLLPGEPSELAREVARTHDLDVDVIWWDGSSFRHEAFE